MKRLFKPGRAITATLVLVTAPLILFSLLRSVDQPTTQLTVNMRSMGQEYVNIWLDPNPPRMESTTIIAQIADLGGTPRTASSIEFRLGRADGQPVLVEVGEPMAASMNDMSKRGRFSAALDFPEPGRWWIDVIVQMGDEQAVVRLPVEVAR